MYNKNCTDFNSVHFFMQRMQLNRFRNYSYIDKEKYYKDAEASFLMPEIAHFVEKKFILASFRWLYKTSFIVNNQSIKFVR